MMYLVCERTQLNLDGVVYGPGEVIRLDDDTAAPLVAAGTIEPITPDNDPTAA